MNMPEYHPGLSAAQAHVALTQSVRIIERAQHCAELWFAEIFQRKLYRDLGFSSMNQYAAETLGFSRSRIGDFMMLAKKLESLPAVKAELAAGRLGYTKAREIVPVAEAERDRRTNPAQTELMPVPTTTTPPAQMRVRVGFEFSPLQHARYEALMARINHRSDRAELLLEMLESFLSAEVGKSPRGEPVPQYQIHVHSCPQCDEATVQTPQGERVLSETEREVASCDAKVHRPGRANKSTIAPKTRREVFARDRHKCRRRGCHHTRHLHIHHIMPRTEGGGHEQENLVTLCSACHHLWHDQGGDLQGLLSEVRT